MIISAFNMINAKMKKLSLLIVLLCSLFFACTKDEIKIDPDNLLIGTWNYSEYTGDLNVYTRSLDFSDTHGYKFNSDGTFIERSITGWCATPPVSYSNYPGTWAYLNDTLIQINGTYWGGTITYKLDIESVSSSSLKVIRVSASE